MTPDELIELARLFHESTSKQLDDLGQSILDRDSNQGPALELVDRLKVRCSFFAGTVHGFASKVKGGGK